MKKHNAENERAKRSYFVYLKEAKRQSEQSVDAAAKALARFEEYNRNRPFKAFHYQQAVGFKNYLADQVAQRTGEKLSKSTLHATLANLRRFFQWLAGQPGYKSKFTYSDADYFNLSENDVRVASAKRDQKAPTLEQIRHLIAQMPSETEIEKRDRALVAFTILTGARDGAIASLRLKHVDMVDGCVMQDAREVKTKFRKSFTTYFFPVGGDFRRILDGWVGLLRDEKLWGLDDPLFPSTSIKIGQSRHFEVAGLDRKPWSNATPIRKVFREAFERAGLPYFNPHSFRQTLVLLGEQICKTPEDFKAWSQNLGHEQVLTTFLSYGEVPSHRQGQIIQQLDKPRQPITSDADLIAEAVFRKLNAAASVVGEATEQQCPLAP